MFIWAQRLLWDGYIYSQTWGFVWTFDIRRSLLNHNILYYIIIIFQIILVTLVRVVTMLGMGLPHSLRIEDLFWTSLVSRPELFPEHVSKVSRVEVVIDTSTRSLRSHILLLLVRKTRLTYRFCRATLVQFAACQGQYISDTWWLILFKPRGSSNVTSPPSCSLDR
jgi:hypothetical protein